VSARLVVVLVVLGATFSTGCGDNDDGTVEASRRIEPASTTAAPPQAGWRLGATDAQVAATQALIARTQKAVAKYPSLAAALDAGYLRANKGHMINVAYMTDDRVVDAAAIESLVVGEVDGKETIVGGMYALPIGKTLADVPDIGGPLLVWHAHGTLCATANATLVPVDRATDTCPTGSVAVRDLPMVHVWSDVQPNEDGSARDAERCGVFQYLDLPHHTKIEGCSGKSAGGGHAIAASR
jgi:hypothetical protein